MSHRVLISGMGSIGQRHAKNLKDLKVEEIASFDPCTKSFDTYESALEIFKPTIVFICSPTNLHIKQAIKAVHAGCHVFIEKPLSYSMNGVLEIEREVAQRNLTTMVACNMRFHPGPALIHRYIEEGQIGNVVSARLYTGSYLPRWRPESDYTKSYSASAEFGGAIMDCIHEIDLALWNFGPASLVGSSLLPAMSIDLPEVEGTAELILRHESGVLSSLHLNFVQHNYERSFHVVGSRGTVTWDWDYGDKNFVRIYGKDGVLNEEVYVSDEWDFNQVYVDEVKHFLEAVLKKEDSCCPVYAGRAALEIGLEAKKTFTPSVL